MRKVFLFFIILLIPTSVFAISASSYVVMDQNSGRVLLGSNYDSSSLIASITKIMTAIVVIENSDLDSVITVGDDVLKAYGSAIYIEVGEEISIRDLLYGLMLRSGNDAALILSLEVAGSLDEFAVLMNEKVSELNLSNTVFFNPSGLDEETENKSTAYDMAVIMSYAMKNEVFSEITGTYSYTAVSSYKTYTWTNKNRLLSSYDYCTGGKTGYTQKANRTLVTTASKDNMDIVVVTLNDGNDFADHEDLYETIFASYESVLVIDKDVTSFKGDDNTYYVENDYFALIKLGDYDNLSVTYEIYNEPVNKVAGIVYVIYDDEVIYSDNLYLVSESNEENLGFFARILEWFKSW